MAATYGREELGTFVSAVEHGGLSAAARALGVPKSTVSRRIQRLEEQLGQSLLQRSARVFRLTEAGDELFRRAAPAFADLDEAAAAVRDHATTPQGELRVTAPVDLGSTEPLVHTLLAFHQRYPAVHLHLDLTDRVVDVLAEGYDVAIRAHPGALQDRAGLMCRVLGRMNGGLFATRAYLDARGRPDHPRDLARHDCFAVSPASLQGTWVLRRSNESWPVAPAIVTGSMSFVRAATEAGAGIGVLPLVVGLGLRGDRELERVLPDWELPAGAVSLLWPASRQLAPRIRAFLDFVVASFEGGGCPAAAGEEVGAAGG